MSEDDGDRWEAAEARERTADALDDALRDRDELVAALKKMRDLVHRDDDDPVLEPFLTLIARVEKTIAWERR